LICIAISTSNHTEFIYNFSSSILISDDNPIFDFPKQFNLSFIAFNVSFNIHFVQLQGAVNDPSVTKVFCSQGSYPRIQNFTNDLVCEYFNLIIIFYLFLNNFRIKQFIGTEKVELVLLYWGIAI
jgi:hypothetical protein